MYSAFSASRAPWNSPPTALPCHPNGSLGPSPYPSENAFRIIRAYRPLAASVTTTRDRVAVNRFTFEMGDPKHLGHVLKAVRAVDGVYDAYRVTSGVTPARA